jgi:hypothetical protein
MWGVTMSDLVTRLRTAAPVGKLLQEAADALDAAEHRVAELAETLRAVVEISNSQRAREFADVKRTLDKARALLVAAPAASRPAPAAAPSAPPPAAAPSAPPAIAAPSAPPSTAAPSAPPPAAAAREPAPAAGPDSLGDQCEEDVISGMYKEIKSLLRHSA